MDKLIYETMRSGYSTDQIKETMTVGELMEFLDDFDPDTPIYLSFDNGYTYGGIEQYYFRDEADDEDEEDW